MFKKVIIIYDVFLLIIIYMDNLPNIDKIKQFHINSQKKDNTLITNCTTDDGIKACRAYDSIRDDRVHLFYSPEKNGNEYKTEPCFDISKKKYFCYSNARTADSIMDVYNDASDIVNARQLDIKIKEELDRKAKEESDRKEELDRQIKEELKKIKEELEKTKEESNRKEELDRQIKGELEKTKEESNKKESNKKEELDRQIKGDLEKTKEELKKIKGELDNKNIKNEDKILPQIISIDDPKVLNSNVQYNNITIYITIAIIIIAIIITIIISSK
jgi:molecular chaperone DnaK (HSP70)